MTATAALIDAHAPLTRSEFEEAVERARPSLRAFAMRLARNSTDADDLMQEALLRAWRGLGSFRRGTHFDRWAMRIVRNVFLNRVRKNGRTPVAVDPVNLQTPARAPSPPQLVTTSDLPRIVEHVDDELKSAVESLPEPFRTPFVLFALGGRTYQEIADALGIPIGTVMSRLHRARSRLRTRLAAHPLRLSA